MTELATQEMAIVPARSGGLFFNVQKFELAQRVANVFASSTMVPDHFKNNIGNCLIALNLAERMECDPFMLLQNMYIVHGKPGIEAKLAIALVNASGKFTPIQYEFNSDKTECVVYAKRTDTGEECRSVPVSMQMAKNEGWTSKKGSKWQTMPQLMLQYRAAMFFARAYCPESLLGMQSREELHDTYDMTPGPGGYEMAQPQTTNDLQAKLEGVAENGKYAEQVAPIDRDMGKAQDEPVATIEKPISPETLDNATAAPTAEDFRSKWIKLRTSGFSTFVFKHLDEFKAQSEADRIEAKDKWQRMYPAKPWPLDMEFKAPQETAALPEDEPAPAREPVPQQKKDGPPPWYTDEPKANNTIVPADQSDAYLEAEQTNGSRMASQQAQNGGQQPQYFHDIDQLAAMSPTLQRIYAEAAEVAQCLSEEVSPKSINVTLKKRYPAQWGSVREKLGFSLIPATDQAADRWNDDIVALVDGGMKV